MITRPLGKQDYDHIVQIIDRWWYREPRSGETFFFVPNRGIHTSPGGTISLGDTIDSAALIYALDTERTKPLHHPATFARR